MVAIASFKKEAIERAVQQMYTAVARHPERRFHFPTGRAAARLLGYPDAELDALPGDAIASFAGVGYPFQADAIREGDIVLDVGSGSGTDALIASRRAGPRGKVYALDITEPMRAKLADIARRAGANIEVVAGNAEAIPLPDASVDVATTNGVLNLVPDKARAIEEIHRVLKPGGRLAIADIALGKPVSFKYRQDPDLWAECVVGAVEKGRYLEMLRAARFGDVEILDELDYFAASNSPETRKVAALFGAQSIVLRARRRSARSRLPALGTGWRRRGLRLAQEGAGIAGAWLAAGICAGMPALLSMLSAAGAGALARHAYMFPLFVVFVALSTWLLHGSGRTGGHVGPFRLALASGVLAIASFWLSVTELVPAVWYGAYVGLAGLGAASVWAFVKARDPVSCLDEMVREAERERHGFAASHPLARGAVIALAAAAVLYAMYKSVDVFVGKAEAMEIACADPQTCKEEDHRRT
ncbi:hypothetical protein SVA_2553 [Sulfurifustis variabilis]|uniref:Methyltransferase domain-containing protein n=1 Tax=Sulfurifustis variabilis TaxID=1675686 RepID=A0A1B4VCD6_9GAMM|nr:methyltransferase domain-containing protein [Sulfurifustis variabilis]BAU49101.1 hypothetical protein SVA_2553 [Sulfurifustis variabilis]